LRSPSWGKSHPLVDDGSYRAELEALPTKDLYLRARRRAARRLDVRFFWSLLSSFLSRSLAFGLDCPGLATGKQPPAAATLQRRGLRPLDAPGGRAFLASQVRLGAVCALAGVPDPLGMQRRIWTAVLPCCRPGLARRGRRGRPTRGPAPPPAPAGARAPLPARAPPPEGAPARAAASRAGALGPPSSARSSRSSASPQGCRASEPRAA
jgi:hypothetical protein